jgi:hypothetical protein
VGKCAYDVENLAVPAALPKSRRVSTLFPWAVAGVAGITVALVAIAPLGGCIQQNAGDAGTAASAEGGVSATGLVDGGAAGPTALGADCITEPSTGVQICSAISVCPNVVVDHDIYPDCGWRIRGQALDLECACSGMVCPLGAPATCDQAAKLMADQTEQIVCQQVNDGRCTPGTATGSSGSSGASGSTSTCDTTCAGECHNDPSCLLLCGC